MTANQDQQTCTSGFNSMVEVQLICFFDAEYQTKKHVSYEEAYLNQ